MKIISRGARETKKVAADLAKKIKKIKGGQATVVALSGDLGAGKTTFAQGFAKGLGIKQRMVSPTFLIFRNYHLKKGIFHMFYHVDVYRIHSAQELTPLGFKKILADPHHLVLIEWAERIKKILPKSVIWVKFTHGRKENERLIAY